MADGQVSIDYGRIANIINSVGYELESKIETEVGSVRSDLKTTRAELNKLQQSFVDYVEQYERTQRVQRAEIVKNTVQAEIDRQFGHYREVRRVSYGLLQALDIGNVTNDTVQHVTEEQMIKTPGYWLAAVVVALAAWTRGDKDVADASIKEAFSRDKAKTALFFALILRREGRMAASVAWLRSYFASLDPRSLGREFAVVLECITNGAFGPEGAAFITEQLQDWNLLLRDDEEIIQEQIGRWKKAIGSLAQQPDVKHYDDLKLLSPDWPRLQAQLTQANGLYNFRNDIDALREKTLVRNINLVEMLDDILELLVREFDTDELPKRRELAAQQAVIDSDGYKDAEQLINETSQAGLEERLDLLQLQGVCVFAPETIGVGVGTQKVALGASRDIARDSVSQYTLDYRSKAIAKADLVFDENHSNYAQNFGFVGVRMDTTVPQPLVEQSLATAWHQSFQSYIAAVSFKPKEMAVPIVLASLAALLFILIGAGTGAWPLTVVVLLLAGGIVGYMYYSKSEKAKKLVAEAQQAQQEALDYSVMLYRDASAQWVDAMLAYEDLDSEEVGLLAVLDTWAAGKELFEGVDEDVL